MLLHAASTASCERTHELAASRFRLSFSTEPMTNGGCLAFPSTEPMTNGGCLAVLLLSLAFLAQTRLELDVMSYPEASVGGRRSRTARPTLIFIAGVIGVALCPLVGTTLSPRGARAQERGGTTMLHVRASDIGSKVAIGGRLGVPLGRVVTIRGEWSRRDASGRVVSPKEGGLRLVVSTINGDRLERPLDFRAYLLSPILPHLFEDFPPAKGDVWEIRGIETGSYLGVPDEVFQELPDLASPAMAFEFGFYTEFKYFSRRVVR